MGQTSPNTGPDRSPDMNSRTTHSPVFSKSACTSLSVVSSQARSKTLAEHKLFWQSKVKAPALAPRITRSTGSPEWRGYNKIPRPMT